MIIEIEKQLASYIIDVTWEELFGVEDYDVELLANILNKEIKRLKKDHEETNNE